MTKGVVADLDPLALERQDGELTLRGVTHGVSLHVQQYEFTSGTTGERRARFFATGHINRQAFWVVRLPVPLDRRRILAGNDTGIELLIVCHTVTSRREGGPLRVQELDDAFSIIE